MTSSFNHLEDLSQAHIVTLLLELLTSAKDFEYLSEGFDRDCDRTQRDLTFLKSWNGRYGVKIMLKSVFAFAEP